MATAQAETEARGQGDVVRSRLAPLAGALLGAGLALEVTAERGAARLVAWAREMLGGREGDPKQALTGAWSVLIGLALPIILAAFAGAMVVGLFQTRAYLGRLAPATPDRPGPTPLLAMVGWIALAVLALDGLRALTLLATPADPVALGRAAAALGRDLARVLFVVVAAVAFVDHLLRARARRVRLDAEAGTPARRPLAAVAEPTVDALLGDGERLLYDGDVALVLGRRHGAWWALSRARGLLARALVDAARRKRLVVRTGSPIAMESVVLGAPLAAGERRALDLPAEGSP